MSVLTRSFHKGEESRFSVSNRVLYSTMMNYDSFTPTEYFFLFIFSRKPKPNIHCILDPSPIFLKFRREIQTALRLAAANSM